MMLRYRKSAVVLALATLSAIPVIAQQAAAPPAPRPDTGSTAALREQTVPSPPRTQSIKDGVQITKPQLEDYIAMLDSLPAHAPVTAKKPRKVLVLATPVGYFHPHIPLTAATVKALGEKTGAYATTVSFDAADINTENLAQYDAIFLDSTTFNFLDDPKDATATANRKAALLAFVRGGKGLIGLHAASDSYHTTVPRDSKETPVGTWPEFNTMIGGVFKWHWSYPQPITVKLDDPKSPLTTMFHNQEFVIHDEVDTFTDDSFSRKNVHVLFSLDYAKMSDVDKAKEPAATKRKDGDYALSWIRKEGKGRVFYLSLGHSEHDYAITPLMEHMLAGIQYSLGDLKADDSPSVR